MNRCRITKASAWTLTGLLTVGIWAARPEVLPQNSAVLAQEAHISEEMAWLRQTTRKWIEIDVSRQRLIAWEGNSPVYAVIVSTGRSQTPTIPGVFSVQSMHRTTRMQGEDYDVPDVPYAMYYHRGYAIHGTYWHNNFGTPMSHGCTNVAVDHAQWIFNWASIGTPVVVH